MTELTLESKSLMLTPICDGDHVAAAILDWLYLYFQYPNPYKLFCDRIQDHNSEEIISDFFRYSIQEYYAPFDLDIDHYPDKWFSITLAELRLAIREQFAWKTKLLTEDLIDALKLLQNKNYMSIEDWELFEDGKNALYSEYQGKSSPVITCWLYVRNVDYAVMNYYHSHFVAPLVDERINTKREKRIVSNQGHRAKRIGQAASLTFEEWIATITYFNMRCAFCQERPYEVLEHFIPVIHGGTTSVFNCVPACELCNAIKNDCLPHEILEQMKEERIQEIHRYLEHRRQQWIQKKKGD